MQIITCKVDLRVYSLLITCKYLYWEYLVSILTLLQVLSQYLKNVFICKGNTCEYWHNTCKFWSNFDQFQSLWLCHYLKIDFQSGNYRFLLQNCFKTYKYCDNTREYYTCRWTHFSSIGSILVSIITILASIVTILVSIEQVNEYTLRMVISRIGQWWNVFFYFISNEKNVKLKNYVKLTV